ncbi:DUF1642 domain-containing protein [Lacticaseibacillus rhamnosus]|uniref:DUF1642 domain-containing protein n=1 Tax=Lacticaseibacillus rhamnosus TaxID=47715 RepID=UPI000532DFCE|nr:DUF1642 domain-containing protein [Lacticaseibacillus rhamnosus]
MSEEKLYAVKNRSGEFWDFSDSSGFWSLAISDFPTTPNKKQAELAAKDHGGHVVTFVEEPKKVVLTKEQAEIVERAHSGKFPAASIAFYGDDDEEPLMNAYVNGYTVKKKYLVYKVLVDKNKHEYFAQAYRSTVHPGTVAWFLHSKAQSDSLAQFTEAEIEHYSLQDCEKVWCDSDD